MLTLKLANTRTGHMEIHECATVTVCREPGLAKVTAKIGDGEQVFEVGTDTFNVAYIENSKGITTQVVRP
jgi:alpha-D-ribose 1-methylphosphonate 5-triphosphate synthase subunit PhnG